MEKRPLFSAYGVELEYMIVDGEGLSIMPISDKLIYDVVGQFQNEVEFEKIAWSNELVLHVIELKTNGPALTLECLTEHFQAEVTKINTLLQKYHAKLLPTGAHPLMNPFTEAKLWPHDANIIYETYDRIFDCKGHGWSNLQSVHLNLPFANDAEFAQLHTAIRVILPLIPALCASTPIVDGKITGLLDTRLEFYRLNQQKIPFVTGDVIPELVFSQQEYEDKILAKMYQAIANEDVDKVLQEEWLNSRGAIARFDRNTIEIRIIDTQECPAADLAIISLIVATLKSLIAEKWSSFSEQASCAQSYLKELFVTSLKQGLATQVSGEYSRIFGGEDTPMTLQELWQHLLQAAEQDALINDRQITVLKSILLYGNLAQRIVSSWNLDPCVQQIERIYQQLAHCLQAGELYLPS